MQHVLQLQPCVTVVWPLHHARACISDGQNERMNCTVQDMLGHFVSPTMTNWDELLVHVQFAINNAWQESVQNTPFARIMAGILTRHWLSHWTKRGQHPRKVRILLLLLLQHICSKPLLAPNAACLMHSKGRSVTVITCMFLPPLKWALKYCFPQQIFTSRTLVHASS